MPRTQNIENIARRKEQIMRAAISAFARRGLKGTSMNDIVAESGLSKGAIYWYFKSKDEIIDELLNTFFDPGEIKVMDRLVAAGTARERIDRLTDYTVDAIKRMRKYRPVIQELYVIAFRDQKIRKMARKTFDQSTEMMERIIRYGIRHKEFRRVNPYTVAVTVFEIVEGAALFWFLGMTGLDIADRIRDGVNMVIESISIRE